MSRDTTPVVGDVWEWDGETRTLVVVEGRVKFWMALNDCALMVWCDLAQWHAWAENARRVW